MLASYQWLRSLVPQLTATPEELAERMTSAGLEVEGLRAYGAGSESCVIVRVVSARPHPTRSSLRLVTVAFTAEDSPSSPLSGSVAASGEPPAHQEIVCGAPNVPEPGWLVVLAPIGTHLPAKGITLEKKAIGGIESAGMLVSESELGLTEEHDGIIVLEPGFAKPGTRFADAVPEARDTILSIGVTPNRPDALGHIGIAREVAALFALPWAPPEPELPAARDESTKLDALATVTIEDGERCAHFGTAAVLGITVGPSPLGVRYRLSALGVRPISNIVDVTNLVMLEFGHSMHAFDLEFVRDKRIVVRRARPGEVVRTLDEKDHELVDDDLLVCDGQGPVALAGIMGGANSEIRTTTTRVLLECAYFDARGIRRTSRRHGVHTEASHRFERGVDHGDARRVLTRAASWMQELAGGKVVPEVRLTVAREIPPVKVRLRGARLDQLLGVHVPQDEAVGILTRLGFEVVEEKAGEGYALDLTVPTHRPDVTREVDVIDEIARVRGLETLPSVLPPMHPRLDVGGREESVRRARAAAVELGLSEALLFGFVPRRALEAMGAPAPAITIANPMSERDVMRTSLLPGLCEAVARASRHGEHDVRLFALGPIFLAAPPSDIAPPTEERLSFAAVLAGERTGYLTKPEAVDVWDAKAIALGWIARITGGREATVQRAEESERPHHLHPRGAAFVSVEGQRVGTFGPIHPDVADALELPQGVLAIEMDLAKLVAIGAREPKYAAIPRFPASVRDMAVVVSEAVAVGEVERAVREAAGALGEQVRLFDRFAGGAIPAGHASLAFHVVYRAADRTLTDAEVDAQHTKVVETVRSRFGATLRA